MADTSQPSTGADRRKSYGSRAASPAPTDASRRSGSLSKSKPGKGGKSKRGKGRKGSASPKGSFNADARRESRKKSMTVKESLKLEDAAKYGGNRESLFQKTDARFKEIKRQLTRRQREQKKETQAGEERRQEL